MELLMVLLDGFNDAIVGQAFTWENKKRKDKFVYDGFAMVNILVKRDGMTIDEAHEFIEYYIETSKTNNFPIIMWSILDMKEVFIDDLKTLKGIHDGTTKLH